MIIRIMGEGQFQVPEANLDQLNKLDDDLLVALESKDPADESRFTVALAALLAAVRAAGSPLPDDSLEPSELMLPASDATRDDVLALLREEGDGLIPGGPVRGNPEHTAS